MVQYICLGLDVGSTTIKALALDPEGKTLYSLYQRHNSAVRAQLWSVLKELAERFPAQEVQIALTGSGALGIAQDLNLFFVQEVLAATTAINTLLPRTDVAIELGGEDAKITFFTDGIDQRMNETCAGGTGAFIDQMATVLQTDAAGLDELANRSDTLYPIAARCGVFAKTDVMPLLNEGAKREDIAASIFQAVVNQTIGGLACGKSIRGNIAFLGGPLHFLLQLRHRFVETLKLTPEQILAPEDGHYFVAHGAAIAAKNSTPIILSAFLGHAEQYLLKNVAAEQQYLDPLFASEQEKEEFLERSNSFTVEYAPLEEAEGDVFFGLDAGSTTTKAVLLDRQNRILAQWYGSNLGSPLKSTLLILKDLYARLPQKASIRYTIATGYGEAMLKAAFGFDEGEVETIAHFKAAVHFTPEVSFILDIGGQDMKCLFINHGVITKIVLNEACSSGCGSFIESFASSLGVSVSEFAEKALEADNPVDLGSRCTVFMNSRVKQAQKEGVSIANISAGLSYSVIKNALYKVIRITQPEELGKHVVVQGGAFLNPAVLRALEKCTNHQVIRPTIAGLMGAFGAALLAKERAGAEDGVSTLLQAEHLDNFSHKTKIFNCSRCTNMCQITANTFSHGKTFFSGNRCEKGLGATKANAQDLPNMFAYKLNRLFNHYTPLPENDAPFGVIGIPRALNIYENYPLWFTLFTSLGFKVQLSDESSLALYNSGLESISSQTVCYPAKVAHGHIENLVNKGIKTIFFPCIPYEVQESDFSHANFNCPVVAGYPDVLRLNMDVLVNNNVVLWAPFVSIQAKKHLVKQMFALVGKRGVSKSAVVKAIDLAFKEQEAFKADIRRAGAEAAETLERLQQPALVLGGRPYHLDPFINHGIPELVIGCGMGVLTEDSVAHLADRAIPLSIVDQWVYHSRLYHAADFVVRKPLFEVVQLTSFGCGIDAITAGQVEEILKKAHKFHTLLKIDEGSNLGAVRIRIRSLMATLRNGQNKNTAVAAQYNKPAASAQSNRHILCPQLSPIHMELLQSAVKPLGFSMEVMPKVSTHARELGLKYFNNDICYPAILVGGQMLEAVFSGKYNLDEISFVMFQTGGSCRASNYIHLFRNALKEAGCGQVPVYSFSLENTEKDSPMPATLKTVYQLVTAFIYGDLLLRLSNATRPYEKEAGSTDALLEVWQQKLRPFIEKGNKSIFKEQVKAIVTDFAAVPVHAVTKPKIGIVGEILLKYHPDANGYLALQIEKEGGEAVVSDMIDFFLYCACNAEHGQLIEPFPLKQRIINNLFIRFVESYRDCLRAELKPYPQFGHLPTIRDMEKHVQGFISTGHQSGEGWLLAAEMIALLESGVNNIVLVQPFGCLPNHITGKGVLKVLKGKYPEANITAIDYDASASEVNQLNRIKLMASVAHQRHAKENGMK